MSSNSHEFREAIQDAGLEPPEIIEPGKWHRFPGVGKRNSNTAGWCKLFDDRQGGVFGDWSSGLSETWQAKRSKPYSQAEAERNVQCADAAKRAAAIWDAAEPANDDHPYLIHKGVQPHEARVQPPGADDYPDWLVIPVRAATGAIQSLHFISPEGEKRFLSGGRIEGGHCWIGNPMDTSVLCVAEGFATSATIHQATGYPVAVAFNAGNLKPVAKALRRKWPNLKIILCADNDLDTKAKGNGNPGLTKAREAAKAVGGMSVVPDFGPDRPQGATDFNDLQRERGLEVVKQQLEPVIEAVNDPVYRPDPLEDLEDSCGGREPKQTNQLIELVREAELFHTSDKTAFCDLKVNGHRKTWPVCSREFKLWLIQRFFEETGSAPNSQALKSALDTIAAKAHFQGPELDVHVRIGEVDDKLYLDLGDEAWRAVEIDSNGWRVVEEPLVRFRRPNGMQSLLIPQPGGSIEMLRGFLNVRDDKEFVLVVAWALAVLRNRGPYPVLALSGEQGSAKSTFSGILRALLDPNTVPLRTLPRDDHDLFIAATNSHVLVFDNLSGLPAWISDTLCRIATGGGYATRELYTDKGEALFDVTRPMILNGIEDIVTRSDLADRAIFLTLEPIPEENRRSESELWAVFEAERPKILGALLDAVARGLKMLPET